MVEIVPLLVTLAFALEPDKPIPLELVPVVEIAPLLVKLALLPSSQMLDTLSFVFEIAPSFSTVILFCPL